MKNKIFYFIMLLTSFCFISCEKLDQLLTFDVTDDATFTIPSSAGLNIPLNIPVPTIQSSATNTFKNNNTHASLVKNVVLKELKLNILEPDNVTFKFLKSIEIYISAQGEKEVLLASIYDVPLTVGNELILNPSGNKLDPYLKKENYSIRNVVEIREVPGESITIKANMTFQITADPI